MNNLSKTLVVGMLALGACGGDEITVADVDALETIDLTVGTGATATAGKTVSVHYTGWLYDTDAADHKGSEFDSSIGSSPIEFQLGVGYVIDGWDQGLEGMKVGGKRRLIIPSRLGYGPGGNGPIPPNAALVFDVELVNVR